MRGQIVHVLRKDLRHHWPEIAIAIALLATFAWVEPRTWTGFGLTPGTQALAAEIGQFLVLAWALLVVRLVQGENLVGDRQFWVTRPYEWNKLLAEKFIFAVVFINGPLLIADALLLAEAGFTPTRFVLGLLWLQLLWVAVLILPAMSLGSITSGIGQAVLVVLGVIVCWIALFAVLENRLHGFTLPRARSIGSDILGWLALGAIPAVIVWQYARRRTLWVRVVLAVALVSALLISTLARPSERAIARAYPSVGAAQAPVQFSFDPQKQDWQDIGYAGKSKVPVGFPLNVSGINQDAVIVVDGTALMIEAPNGKRWSSGWQSGTTFFTNYHHTQSDFVIDKAVYDGMKSIPVKARILFALEELRERNSMRIVAQAAGFDIPWNGHCSLSPNEEMACLFPLRTPPLLLRVQQQDFTCSPPKAPPLPAGSTGYAVTGYWDSGWAEFGFSSVRVSHLGAWNWGGGSSERTNLARRGVCPGTQMDIGSLTVVRSMQTEIEIDGIRLADYELKNVWGEGGGVAFDLRSR